MHYKVTLLRVRIMFIPPRLFQQPDTISAEESVGKAI